jgi:hypothetical protein
MFIWFFVAGILVLALGAGVWYDHKHGRSISDRDAMNAVRAQRTRAADWWGP